MPLGRPRAPGTEAERAEARRAKVRKNVQAFRQRQKEKKLLDAAAKAAHREEGGSGRVGGVICRDAFLDASSTSTEVSSISARSSPGLRSNHSYQNLLEQDYGDPDSWMWRLPQDLAGNVPYQEMFTGIPLGADSGSSDHRGRTRRSPAPSFEPFRNLAGCGSTWYHHLMMETVDPGLEVMNDACLASALTIISRERQDNDMCVSAAYIQNHALRQLRQSLQQWTETPEMLCPISLSMAALTCAMSELIVSKSWANFASHLGGVGSLLSYHNPATLTTRAARELFYGYRSLEAAFAFAHGRSLFLSDPRWIDLPWKDEIAMSQHPLHRMLDIAFRLLPDLGSSPSQKQCQSPPEESSRRTTPIPGEPWQAKMAYRQRQHSNERQRQQTQALQEAQTRLGRLRRIASDLDFWEAEFREQQSHLGGLHQKKESEWPGLYDFAFDFTSLEAATAYAVYTGVRVRLAEATYAALCSRNEASRRNSRSTSRNASPPSLGMTLMQSAQSTAHAMEILMTTQVPLPPPSAILPSSSPSEGTQAELADTLLQGLRWARQALQSLEFFHTGVMKDCGWVATLFAFDAAWSFLSSDGGARELEAKGQVHLTKEREWCTTTAARFETLGVPLLAWR